MFLLPNVRGMGIFDMPASAVSVRGQGTGDRGQGTGDRGQGILEHKIGGQMA